MEREAAVVREASPLCFPEKAAQTGEIRLHGRCKQRQLLTAQVGSLSEVTASGSG